MIDSVIFDIGMVLINWHPKLDALFDVETARIVEDAIWGGEQWNQLDEGIIDEEILFDQMVARAPAYEEKIRFALAHLEVACKKFDYAIPWVKELKAMGYKVYFLSNYSRHLRKSVPEPLQFISYMDGGVWSCDVKLLKPDLAIYETILRNYKLIPDHCLFIDDRLENVEGARSSGMHSIPFISYEQSYSKIMKYLEDNYSKS